MAKKKCSFCGKLFEPKRSTAQFCSTKCRVNSANKKKTPEATPADTIKPTKLNERNFDSAALSEVVQDEAPMVEADPRSKGLSPQALDIRKKKLGW